MRSASLSESSQPIGIVEGIEQPGGIPPDVLRKPYMLMPEAVSRSAAFVPDRVSPELMPRALWSRPPWIEPPEHATMLDLPLNRIPQVIAPGSTVQLVEWPVIPQGAVGVVRRIAYVVTSGSLSDGVFSTRINAAVCLPFTRVVGAVGSLESPQETQIILRAGDVFSAQVENVGTGSISAAVRTYGWWYRE